jgi:hypothetical protein
MLDLIRFVFAVFACYRLSELIAIDDGPGDMFLWLRAKCGAYDIGEDSRPVTSLGRFIECPYCLGVWFAAVLALVLWPIGWMMPVRWLAIAGGQAFLQSAAGRS